MIEPLETGKLYTVCDIDQFSFDTTDQLPDLKEIIGQDRALQALHFGVNIQQVGYNLFVLGPNGFIYFGKSGEIATNNIEDQEIAVLSLHLLQVSLVYINTLMTQQVLKEPEWSDRMTARDMRALSPLPHSHINPYGVFDLDMDERLELQEIPLAV